MNEVLSFPAAALCAVALVTSPGDTRRCAFVDSGAFETGGRPLSMVFADLDGDGDIDAAVSRGVFSGSVEINLNDGNGVFTQDASYTFPPGGGGSVVAGDLDGDDDVDLMFELSSEQVGYVWTLFNNGDATFTGGEIRSVNDNVPRRVALADLDGDDDLDLALLAGDLLVFRNDGKGAFGEAVVHSIDGSGQGLVAGDLDGDGDTDLAIGRVDTGAVSILRNKGDADFENGVDYPAGYPGFLLIADFDGDAYVDLAVTHQSGLSILLNDGEGGLREPVGYPTGNGARGTTACDLDGDGDPDLAVADWEDGAVRILINAGDGTFGEHVIYDVAGLPRVIRGADVDGDLDVDLMVMTQGPAQVSVLLYECTCPEDLDFSGDVDLGDVVAVLAAWGPCETDCPEDLDGSGDVGFGDVVVVLGAWGACQ